MRWAFEEEAKVGDIKRFTTNDGYIVAQITRKTPKGTERVEDVSARVTPILRNQKKAEIIRGKFSGSTIEELSASQSQTVKSAIAVSMKSPTIAGAGNEPKVVGAAFGLGEGVVSEPIDGDKGVYVVKVTKVTEATPIDNYATYANQETTKLRLSAAGKVLQALKDAAEIEDNSCLLYTSPSPRD